LEFVKDVISHDFILNKAYLPSQTTFRPFCRLTVSVRRCIYIYMRRKYD